MGKIENNLFNIFLILMWLTIAKYILENNGNMILILVLFFIMLIQAIYVKFSYSNVENKTIYETTIYEDKNMAILSDLDDKVLIVEYEINENKEAMLKTYNYMIVDKENLVISYKDLGEKIIVIKE